ncbi:hypothetical protein NDU88_004508 [Pleurodeles waltl]|uniref:Uncharacterized protein n=1 Tax=Pleurodeles waltl TaxID=8319 RepID=A0AAV7PCR1_PLEWA|nr:hypothetical protein NDU88_004508 [Pleurodeles waltl]
MEGWYSNATAGSEPVQSILGFRGLNITDVEGDPSLAQAPCAEPLFLEVSLLTRRRQRDPDWMPIKRLVSATSGDYKRPCSLDGEVEIWICGLPLTLNAEWASALGYQFML